MYMPTLRYRSLAFGSFKYLLTHYFEISGPPPLGKRVNHLGPPKPILKPFISSIILEDAILMLDNPKSQDTLMI